MNIYKEGFMKKSILTLFLLVGVTTVMAIFDKTEHTSCVFEVTCPDGRFIAQGALGRNCIEGWGFCFGNIACGEGVTLIDVCGAGGGGAGGGGAGGDQCLLDPFRCNPFAT